MNKATARELLWNLKDWLQMTGGEVRNETASLRYSNGWVLHYAPDECEKGRDHEFDSFESALAELLDL